jgi:hypothetical protein
MFFCLLKLQKKMFPETTPKIIYKIAPILGSILEANNPSPQPSWSWSGTNPRWGPKDLRWMVCSFRPERVGAHSLVAAKNCQKLLVAAKNGRYLVSIFFLDRARSWYSSRFSFGTGCGTSTLARQASSVPFRNSLARQGV